MAPLQKGYGKTVRPRIFAVSMPMQRTAIQASPDATISGMGASVKDGGKRSTTAGQACRVKRSGRYACVLSCCMVDPASWETELSMVFPHEVMGAVVVLIGIGTALLILALVGIWLLFRIHWRLDQGHRDPSHKAISAKD